MAKNKCPNCAAPAPAQPKKGKKWRIPLLIGLLMALLAACGVSGGSETKQPASVDGDSSVTEGTEAVITEEITISEVEIYNQGGIVVTVTGLDSGLFGPEMTVNIVNDSENNILVTSQDVSVNGYMMSLSGLYCDVAAGKKANDDLTIMNVDLDEAGIETITEIAFYLQISDSDTYTTLDTSALLTVQTSAYGVYTQPVDDSGDVVYNANGIRVICKGLKQDLIWDGTVVFYIENNSDQPITVYAEDVSVNGYMVDVGLWSSLRADTKIVDGMYILDLDSLDLDSIDGVEEIEFTLRIIDSDSWGEIDTTDPITLHFSD